MLCGSVECFPCDVVYPMTLRFQACSALPPVSLDSSFSFSTPPDQLFSIPVMCEITFFKNLTDWELYYLFVFIWLDCMKLPVFCFDIKMAVLCGWALHNSSRDLSTDICYCLDKYFLNCHLNHFGLYKNVFGK